MKKYYFFLVLLFIVASCQKDLCYDHSHVNRVEVVFHWDKADSKLVNSMDITMMSLENVTMNHHLNNLSGGKVESPSSLIRAFCYNADSDINRFFLSSWEGAMVTTNETDLISRSLYGGSLEYVPRGGGQDETVRNQPTVLLADTCGLFNVKDRILTFHPQDVLLYIDVVATGVNNIGEVEVASAAISGMSSSMSMSYLDPSDDACTLPFDMEAKGDSIKGDVMSFGHCPSSLRSHILTLYILLKNGAKVYYKYDVSSVLHKAYNNKHIRINIDGLKIPNTKTEGFDPSIDTWYEIKEKIEL